MGCYSPEAINKFSSFVNQAKSEYVERQEMTLEKKLSVIKRCMAEKEFSTNVEMECKLSKNIIDRELQNLNICEIEINNLEALQIVNKIGNIILNREKSNISTNDLNMLSIFVKKSNEVLTSDESQESFLQLNNNSKSSFLNSLSLFSELENNNSNPSKRRIKNSVSTDKLIGSLSISSTDDESIKIHFRLK